MKLYSLQGQLVSRLHVGIPPGMNTEAADATDEPAEPAGRAPKPKPRNEEGVASRAVQQSLQSEGVQRLQDRDAELVCSQCPPPTPCPTN